MPTKGRPRKPAPTLTVAEIKDVEGAKSSLIYSSVRLKMEGLNPPDIAFALGTTIQKVNAALRDPRAAVAERRYMMDQADSSRAAWDAERAAFRVSKAWEVLEDELDSTIPWLRHNAALAVIAADAKGKEQSSRTEIIIAPELAFDDQSGQYLQAPGRDTAIQGELDDIDSVAN